MLLLPDPVPTPVVAFAVRHTGAAAGIQITASHNPRGRQRLQGVLRRRHPDRLPHRPSDRSRDGRRSPGRPDRPRQPVEPAHTDLRRALHRARGRGAARPGSVRVALTPLHGVGGAVAVETLRRAGFDDVHTVASQFAPDPDFPTVAFPNPEEPGATDALLALAAEVGADVAIALDPDADRCAVGIPDRVRLANAVRRRNRLAPRRLHLSQRSRAATPVVASTRGVVADAGRDRRHLRRGTRRDPHRVQMAGARRREPTRHAGVRLRGSDRALRRPRRRARQGRHQRRGVDVRSGGRAACAGPFGARRCSTSWPGATACTRSRRCRAGSATPTRPPR